MKISFLIPNYKTSYHTIKCLESILNYCDFSKLDKEIIIYDDGSGREEQIKQDKRLLKLIEGLPLEVKGKIIVHNDPENKGVGNAFNWMIELSESEYLIRLDNDTVIAEKDFDEKLIKYLEEDEELGLITCRTDRTSQRLQVIKIPDIFETNEEILNYLKNGPCDELTYCSKPVESLAGYCFAFRRKDFDKTKGFCTEMQILGEDNLFYLDIVKLGLKTAIANKLFIHHVHHATSSIMNPEDLQKAKEIAAKKFRERIDE